MHMDIHNWEVEIIFLVVKCRSNQFSYLRVCQDMTKTYLYQLYSLFQVQQEDLATKIRLYNVYIVECEIKGRECFFLFFARTPSWCTNKGACRREEEHSKYP